MSAETRGCALLCRELHPILGNRLRRWTGKHTSPPIVFEYTGDAV